MTISQNVWTVANLLAWNRNGWCWKQFSWNMSGIEGLQCKNRTTLDMEIPLNLQYGGLIILTLLLHHYSLLSVKNWWSSLTFFQCFTAEPIDFPVISKFSLDFSNRLVNQSTSHVPIPTVFSFQTPKCRGVWANWRKRCKVNQLRKPAGCPIETGKMMQSRGWWDENI